MADGERQDGNGDPGARTPSGRALRGLDALNFTLADVRDGLGPYLAIYLFAMPETKGGDHAADPDTNPAPRLARAA